MWEQQLINGLTIGSVYALIAVGLTMVYGVLRILHVAHAGVYVIGAYAGLVTYTYTGSFVLAMLVSMGACAVVGILIQNYVYYHLLSFPPLVPLIASIGLFISVEEACRIVAGPYIHSFPSAIISGEYRWGSVSISATQLLVLFVSILLIVFLWIVVEKTKFGLSMKAVSQDMDMSSVMGIDVQKTTMLTFALSSALAGAAGLVVGVYFNSVYPAMGDVPAYKALAIIVVGGLGNIWGTLLASLIIGLTETIIIGFFSVPLPRDSIAFIAMIAVILLRPEGLSFLFGKGR